MRLRSIVPACWGGLTLTHSFQISSQLRLEASATARAAVAQTALRASSENPAALPRERAFRLVQFPGTVELQTATYKFKLSPIPSNKVEEQIGDGDIFENQNGVDDPKKGMGKEAGGVEVVLMSMVHLADRAYYREIMREACSYDRVLFELIAGPDVSGVDADGRRAVTDYVYPTREQEALARNYGLDAQLNCMNYWYLCKERTGEGSRRRWVLADLDREEIQKLQNEGGEQQMGGGAWQGLVDEVTRALVVGRQAGDRLLPKFFPPLGSSLNKPALVLRALLWLAPCPEAEIMLLDWARTYPRAGGLSALASAIVKSALAGDFFTARKLGFAQQMVSGQAGGGNWGQSDDVLIKARNSVVVEEAERAARDGCKKIMVLYGGLHMQDLASQLSERFGGSRELAGWRTAWLVPTRASALSGSRGRQSTTSSALEGAVPDVVATEQKREQHGGGVVAVFGDEGGDIVTKWGALAVVALGYVAIGAWDWTDTVEALARDLTSGGSPAQVLGSVFVVSALYVARHAYLYYGLARWLVQWEQGLFIEDM